MFEHILTLRMTKHKVDSSESSGNSDIVVNINTEDSDDSSDNPQSQPTQPTQIAQPTTSQPTLSPEELKKLKRFKACFYIALTVFLYAIFQLVYLILHDFTYLWTFGLLVFAFLSNVVLIFVTCVFMATNDVKDPVRIFLTVFCFINFTSACQFADFVGGSNHSDWSNRKTALFYLNVCLLTNVGIVCTFVVLHRTLVFSGHRLVKLCKSVKNGINNKDFWTRFYQCCTK